MSFTTGTQGATLTNVTVRAVSKAATTGTAFTYQFPADIFTDTDMDTLTYTATLDDDSALPDWLNFNASTRTFSGTPKACF